LRYPNTCVDRVRGCTLGLGALAVGAAAIVAGPANAEIEPHPKMLRYPDISRTNIVFVYANDLWVVSRNGGTARPLASPPGQESFPRFSEDGQTVAFVGNYEGNRDLYTIPVQGGIAQRVTHHPTGETLYEWGPDNELIYYAGGQGGVPRATQLFTVSAGGGLPEALPVPYGANGTISDDGQWLAYTPHTRDQRTWKRYRGGMATDIWLLNLEDHTSKQITDWNGTDSLPMWHGDTVYYLSDAGDEHRKNIWAYDLDDESRRQITHFKKYDVKWPAIGPDAIIFQNGSQLYVYEIATNQSRAIEVTIPGDRPTIRPKRVDASRYIQSFDISSTGKRAVVQARGDVWTLPAEDGSPRNLTRSDGIAERTPTWSPDGKWIAYMSDETGEYELYITQSDGKGETRQLTKNNERGYRYKPYWSPDSKHIAYNDKTGRLYLHTIESGETKVIDRDPWNQGTIEPKWAQDSRWITYARPTEKSPMSCIWLYNVETDEKHRVTSTMFNDTNPAIDRRGKFLYYVTNRQFSPEYSDLPADTTFVYTDDDVIAAVPLRKDIEYPYIAESDEEDWEKEEDKKEDEDAEDGEDEKKNDAENAEEADNGEKENGEDEQNAAPTSPIHGTWSGTIRGLSSMQGVPPDMDSIGFTMTITAHEDGTFSGSSEVMGQSSQFDEITFNESTGEFFAKSSQQGVTSIMRGTLDGETLSGTWEVPQAGASGEWDATKESAEVDEDEAEGDETTEEPIEIDLEGFEDRAFQLPVSPGVFGTTAVNNRNQLLFVRRSGSGNQTGVMVFDIDDDSPSEKPVVRGAPMFEISADGKKIIVPRGRGPAIANASAGGSPKSVVTDGMTATIKPRKEWRQLFVDAWRLYRDFFYVPNMHGVDWKAIRKQYEPMLKDCATREDVNFVIGEMIAELNVGHAYRFGGDTEGEPRRNVGMLGVDFELENGAYRIAKIYEGAPWDIDAQGPLSKPGVDINEDDYLLAVNGVPVETDRDPWAAFIGLAGQTVTLTVSEKPERNDDAREIVIETLRTESPLRYRNWIEQNREYVEKKSDGKVGYIYVPDTGVNGQNDLFRQFFGQMHKEALIIDERWNGGGQIPTRFIELLNRPVTNYWQRRDAKNWRWPPDSHQGPKCMLINGLAGSGGDMFPALFKQNDLGPLIGTRTWGGLVGISGNPRLIDGGMVFVPTFGYYETDGTWGIEGHGVDPDIKVIDDPAKMVDGGDPQLDKAIEVMLKKIRTEGYKPPEPPKPPDRSGMGMPEKDK